MREKLLSEEYTLVASCVGEGVAHKYKGFLQLKERVDIESVLKTPTLIKKLEKESEDLGIMYTVICGLATKYENKEILEKIFAVMKEIENKDFGVFLLRLLKSYGKKKFVSQLMQSKIWEESLHDIYSKYIV